METRFQGFVGPSNNSTNTSFDCQRTINFYPEMQEAPTPGREGEVVQFLPTPGLKTIISDIGGKSRGGYVSSNNRLFWMFGKHLYEIKQDGSDYTTTQLEGEFPGYDQVQYTQNETNLFFLANGKVFSLNLENDIPFQCNDTENRVATTLTFMDQYIIFSRGNSNQIYWTELLSPKIKSVFATAESNPDEVVAVISNNLNLWVFGVNTTEIWYSQGDPDLPFIRQGTSVLETGCKAARSIQKIENTICWFASDMRGGVSVVIANGFSPQRISTHALEHEWNKFTNDQLSNAYAYTYKEAGHSFYCLNIPGAKVQYVYDIATGLWHERQSFVNGELTQFRCNSHIYYNGVHLVGDSLDKNGAIHEMSDTHLTENGVHIQRERTTPHISSSGNRVVYKSLVIDVFAGQTLKQDFDPQIMVDWSDDGGLSWSDERWHSAGRVGHQNLRVKLFRLGMGRNRVFRLRVSDPIYWAISGAALDMEGARH